MPSGLTWTLQPSEININKMFKIRRNKYISTALRITNLKLLRTLLLNRWVKYDIQIYIYQSNDSKFIEYAGICNSLDKNKDGQFRGYED